MSACVLGTLLAQTAATMTAVGVRGPLLAPHVDPTATRKAALAASMADPSSFLNNTVGLLSGATYGHRDTLVDGVPYIAGLAPLPNDLSSAPQRPRRPPSGFTLAARAPMAPVVDSALVAAIAMIQIVVAAS
jgi:hypothetical protein